MARISYFDSRKEGAPSTASGSIAESLRSARSTQRLESEKRRLEEEFKLLEELEEFAREREREELALRQRRRQQQLDDEKERLQLLNMEWEEALKAKLERSSQLNRLLVMSNVALSDDSDADIGISEVKVNPFPRTLGTALLCIHRALGYLSSSQLLRAVFA